MDRPRARVQRGITGPNPQANDLARLARDVACVARGETAKVLARIETLRQDRQFPRPLAEAAAVTTRERPRERRPELPASLPRITTADYKEILKADLDAVAKVESAPKMEGRQMIMVISPK